MQTINHKCLAELCKIIQVLHNVESRQNINTVHETKCPINYSLHTECQRWYKRNHCVCE